MGQASVLAANGLEEGYSLVSSLTSPVPIASTIDYLVFVATGQDIQSYQWKFENVATGVIQTATTAIGVASHVPLGLDLLRVSVDLTLQGGAPVTLSMIQEVRPRFTGFEFMFDAPPLPDPSDDRPAVAALGGDPWASEELANDVRTYVLDAAAATRIPARFLAAVAYHGSMQAPKHDQVSPLIWRPGRDQKLDWVASELNADGINLVTDIDDPLGFCQLLLPALAMVVGAGGTTGAPYVEWKEKAVDGSDSSKVDAEILDAFDGLDDTVKVDLFNLARFPRTNIELCARLIAVLRDRASRWPAATDHELLLDPFALATLATELEAGANNGARPTTAAVEGETTLSQFGTSIVSLMHLPTLTVLFPDALQAGADAYGGYNLRRDDSDAARRWGGVNAVSGDPPSGDHVRQLQQDLLELGFGIVGAVDGVLGMSTEWAIRELQIYAKMRFLALEAAPAEIRYVARLQQTLNLYHYAGPISGVVNVGTRIVFQLWKTKGWRCPVVIEVWNTDLDRVNTNKVPIRTVPAPDLGNIWSHNDAAQNKPQDADTALMFARDFTGYYQFPIDRQQNFADPDDLIDVGCHFHRDGSGGPMTRPGGRFYKHAVYPSVWPEMEILPDNLVGVPVDELSPAQLTTFRVVRAVSEVECLAFFDSVNCWDTAFVSMGPAHWTLGLSYKKSSEIKEGELCGYLAYLSAFSRVAFVQAFETFGLRIDEQWIDHTGDRSGLALFDADQRKYTSWVALQGEDGRYSRQYFSKEDADYFRTWHWAYRFLMAGRTIPGFQAGMWDMARIRLRDFMAAPIPAAANVPDIPVDGGAPRRATVGDCFTSEKAAGMLLRWHIFRPVDICTDGDAGAMLQTVVAPNGQPIAGNDPSTWGHETERALVIRLRDQVNHINAAESTKADLAQALDWVMTWPASPGRAGRQYQFGPGVDLLSDLRGSFKEAFDDSGLPPAPWQP